MTAIPDFATPDQQDDFYAVFEYNLEQRAGFINRTCEYLFPNYSLKELDGKTLEVIVDLTSNLLYDTTSTIEDKYPELRPKDDWFSRYKLDIPTEEPSAE